MIVLMFDARKILGTTLLQLNLRPPSTPRKLALASRRLRDLHRSDHRTSAH